MPGKLSQIVGENAVRSMVLLKGEGRRREKRGSSEGARKMDGRCLRSMSQTADCKVGEDIIPDVPVDE